MRNVVSTHANLASFVDLGVLRVNRPLFPQLRSYEGHGNLRLTSAAARTWDQSRWRGAPESRTPAPPRSAAAPTTPPASGDRLAAPSTTATPCCACRPAIPPIPAAARR